MEEILYTWIPLGLMIIGNWIWVGSSKAFIDGRKAQLRRVGIAMMLVSIWIVANRGV